MPKQLRLSRETLRELTNLQLSAAAGGTLVTEMKCKPTDYCNPTLVGCGPTFQPQC